MRLGKTLLEGRTEGEVRYYVARGATGEAVMGPDLGKQVSWPYGAWCLEAMDSHGAWVASAPDLIRFACAFDDPNRSPLLKRETINTMFSRPGEGAGFDSKGQPRISYCGCGWFVKRVGKNGEVNRSHTGSLDGTSTLLLCRPDGVNIAVLFNIRNGSRERVPARAIGPLLELITDQVAEWPDMPTPAAAGD
jgi:N-acyl-D-amino-acid deacylase